MSRDWQQDVFDFHEKFDVPMAIKPELRNVGLRCALIKEESNELMAAAMGGDIVGAVDGVVDLVYVCIGAALAWGVDLEDIWDEVHSSNMSKEGGGTRPDGKLLKGPNYRAPDIARLLKEQGWSGE